MVPDLLWAIALTLSAALLAVTALAMWVGMLGWTTGARLARCERCHRYFLTRESPVHHDGCPEHLVDRVRRLVHYRPHLG